MDGFDSLFLSVERSVFVGWVVEEIDNCSFNLFKPELNQKGRCGPERVKDVVLCLPLTSKIVRR